MSDPRFSVLIPARGAAGFLEECLGSVVAQEEFKGGSCEILLGVDACEETLQAALLLKPRFDALRILWMPVHGGPYLARNTLAYQARSEYLVFFDADDIMLPGLGAWCEKRYAHAQAAKFPFAMFANGRIGGHLFRAGANGVFGIRRDSFMALGAFKVWPCTADSEFQLRASRMFGPPSASPDLLFLYRRHRGSVTASKLYGGRSAKRIKLRMKVKALATGGDFPLRVEPLVAKFEEVE